MIVYVCTEDEDYNNYSVIKVLSDRAAAISWMNEHPSRRLVNACEVDGPGNEPIAREEAI